MLRKKKRRSLRGFKKLAKNIGIITVICSVLIILLNYYDFCPPAAVFPLFSDLDRCRLENVADRLNVTLLSKPSTKFLLNADATRRKSFSAVNTQIVPQFGNANADKRVETDTEFPLELVFEERKTLADNTCKEMLDTALAKENLGIELNHAEESESTGHMEFSVGRPGKRTPKRTYYNENMLQIMRLRNKPKYFSQTLGHKKNRWIHFHRIIESPTLPTEKVVEIKWCPIFKAASTPWLAIFTKLSKALTSRTEAQIKRGKLGFMELARMYRLLTPRIYDNNVPVIKYNMIVTRHPFKRLLSAYRDKIERVDGRLYYYNKYSKKILLKYRSTNKQRPKDKAPIVPTFSEFIRFILSINLKKWDEHWRPMYLDCNPCFRAFDFMLQVETLNDDKDKVMKYLHVTPADPQYKEVEEAWLKWNNPSGKLSKNKTEDYFSQLEPEDMKKLYNLYEPDFRLFGYSPDEYFKMAKPHVKPVHNFVYPRSII